MNRYRYLALPAYLTAAALILIPFTDAALTLWPWKPGIPQWRFGALGLASNAFMIPTAGMLILLVTALTLGHWRTLRVFGATCALLALFTGLSIGLFTLDAIQSGASIQPAVKLSFKVASVTAAVKLAFATLTLAGFAIAGLRTKGEKRAAQTTSAPLVTTTSRAREMEATTV
jgi:hypothetical protein